MKYQVDVGGTIVEVDLTGKVPLVDGKPMPAHVETISGTLLRHFVTEARSLALLAQPGEGRGIWHLLIEGRRIDAEALDERTRAIRAMSGGGEGIAEKVIAAPMPGLVVDVVVAPGDTIRAGQGVVVVEAMKMENVLKAPSDGIVARVEVRAGQAVEKGAVLVVLE